MRLFQDKEVFQMENFHLSRKQMAELLKSLNGQKETSILQLLKRAWAESHQREVKNGEKGAALLETGMPQIVDKLVKRDGKSNPGFSINEIVSLGNLVHYTYLSQGAVQNWVKRDVKELIGSPLLGKKYTVDQAATLFIVEDLKHSLDFESIRHLLTLVFNNPEDRSDDLIAPVDLYSAYATIFEKMQHAGFTGAKSYGSGLNKQVQYWIDQEAGKMTDHLQGLSSLQKDAIRHTLTISVLAVQSACFQHAAKQYLHATYLL